jgi:hypothetical protein
VGRCNPFCVFCFSKVKDLEEGLEGEPVSRKERSIKYNSPHLMDNNPSIIFTFESSVRKKMMKKGSSKSKKKTK